MLGKLVNKVTDGVQGVIKRYENKEFMEAVIASCVLVAYADGTVTPEERQKTMAAIAINEELKHFKQPEVVKTFEEFSKKMDFGADYGRTELLRVVKNIPDDHQANLMISVCIVIGSSDGKLDELEIKTIRDIAKAAGVNPKNFPAIA